MTSSSPNYLVRTALASAIIAAIGFSGTSYAANFDVTVANDDGIGTTQNTLSWAILQANTVSTEADVITLKTDVNINGVMQTLLDSDITLRSDATSHTINGGNQFRPLFVKSGNVVIKNLTVENGKAAGVNSGTGGGGAGLGGALFVYDGTVLVDNVTFNNNNAIGGNHLFSGSKTGGGMFGNVVSGGFGSGGSGGNNAGFGGGVGGDGGDGGFGGGGGGGGRDGLGGSSGSGGSGGYGGGDLSGGGAGFGGAVFAMSGTITLRNTSFSGNTVTAGTGEHQDGSEAGADVFICNSSMDPLCNATVYTQGSTNTTEVVGSLQSWSTVNYNYDVTEPNDDGIGQSQGTLSWAILQANTVSHGADTITLKTDVNVNGAMKTLINSDITLQSDSTKRTISGNNQFRPLFVKSGNITIKNLTLANGKAKGGNSNQGGGGAGLGGALFIYDGNVVIDGVAFNNNSANGGNGGDTTQSLGGGGLFGNGGGYGGGGLFAASTGYTGAYGGNGTYKGDTDFGIGGSFDNSADDGQYGDSGGFGGGGGGGSTTYSGYGYGGIQYGGSAHAGNGGFGSGGGGYNDFGVTYGGFGGSGGFGGGGGGSLGTDGGLGGFGGGNADFTGGGGAGFGGAIFAMKGTTTLINSTFSGNTVTAGSGASGGTADAKDLFICTSDLDPTAAACSAVVNVCNTSTSEVVGSLAPVTDCPIKPTAIVPIIDYLLDE